MNVDFQAIEDKANFYAKQILISGVIGITFLLIIYFVPSLKGFRVPTAFLLPFFLIYVAVLSVFIYKAIDSPLPTIPFLTGAFFVAGGAAFDGMATLIKSPTLSLEANPVARSLLDSGFSSNFVIIYGLISQVLFLVIICILWAAFLKHKEYFVSFAKNNNEHSLFDFMKALMGGAQLSWRQFFLPFTIHEFPTSYYVLWVLTICFLGGSLYRWYLGLNWLGFPSFPLLLMASISVVMPFIGYIIWLWSKFKTITH